MKIEVDLLRMDNEGCAVRMAQNMHGSTTLCPA